MSAMPSQPAGQISLKRATLSEAEELTAFAARSFSDTYRTQMSESDLGAYLAEAFSLAIQATDIADPATTIILARDGSRSERALVGYAQMVERGSHVELKRLYVDIPQKGRGLAVLLMEEARAECRRRDSERLRLTVWTQNPRAIAFYKKMNFAVTGSEVFMAGQDAQIDHVMELIMSTLPLRKKVG